MGVIACSQMGRVGRLGNQLFQLAATIGLARERGDDPLFSPEWIYRPYFSIPDAFFGPIHPGMPEASMLVPHVDPRAQPYLQDFRLFKDHLKEIREYLRPSPAAEDVLNQVPQWKSEDRRHPLLGVHVRRGDNVFDPGVPNKGDYYIVPPLDYYLNAIDWVQREYGTFYIAVVSDDVPWCQVHIPASLYGEGKAHHKEHESDYLTDVPRDWVDLFLLAQCDAFVISGSTFGIWGALLADLDPLVVVRCREVYGPALSHIDSELLFDPKWEVEPWRS